jgi:hypothetical protein
VSQGLHMRRHEHARLPPASPVRERDAFEQNYSCKFPFSGHTALIRLQTITLLRYFHKTLPQRT